MLIDVEDENCLGVERISILDRCNNTVRYVKLYDTQTQAAVVAVTDEVDNRITDKSFDARGNLLVRKTFLWGTRAVIIVGVKRHKREILQVEDLVDRVTEGLIYE